MSLHFVTSYSKDAIVQCMYSFVYKVPSETIKLKTESNVANAAAFGVDWFICGMIDVLPWQYVSTLSRVFVT